MKIDHGYGRTETAPGLAGGRRGPEGLTFKGTFTDTLSASLAP